MLTVSRTNFLTVSISNDVYVQSIRLIVEKQQRADVCVANKRNETVRSWQFFSDPWAVETASGGRPSEVHLVAEAEKIPELHNPAQEERYSTPLSFPNGSFVESSSLAHFF